MTDAATGKLSAFAHMGTCSGERVLVVDRKAQNTAAKAADTKAHGKDRDMGSALRSVYQKTVEETVPDEMLALLGKLD